METVTEELKDYYCGKRVYSQGVKKKMLPPIN